MDILLKIEKDLEKFSRLFGEFCIGEVPDIGSMIMILDELVQDGKKCSPDTFEAVARACRTYVENIRLEKIKHTRPIEETLLLLKAILQHMKKGVEFTFGTEDVMELLSVSILKPDDEDEKKHVETPETGKMEQDAGDSSGMDASEPQAPEKLTEDDMEIMVDFLSEAEENLDSIEVSLIELEQDPSDAEIINNIFRPFHTIKGVSGFLALKKINQLSHITENLLDSARSGEFLMDQVATDAILESVDVLKQLLERVKQGIEKGYRPEDGDIDAAGLSRKLERLHAALTKGDKEFLGEILVKKGVVAKDTLDQALERQKAEPEKRIGEILVEEKKVNRQEIEVALTEQKTIKKQVDAQVKVSTHKLDDLVDYAGELVIAQSMLRQQAGGNPQLSQSVEQLGQIVTKMQTIAMSMRMIPIRATFMKMIRLVRDLSQRSGKEVRLKMSGEDTEIDRNVVDALYEPMVHMIRNSVDHGIETKDIREAEGKSAKGLIFLRAYHKGGQIIIEIEDDGKGLDKERIREKAISSGLIKETDKLTDNQIYNLILEPGFSTADQITDVSGRGVGMDVVKQGIEKFRGHLNMDSTPGKGTLFTISLPLTLAIIDGMLVQAGSEKYVIPITAIHRAFRPEKDNCFTVENKGELIKEREELIPLIRLKDYFDASKDKTPAWESLVIVVESKNEKKGILIDELLGKDEFVIKSLGGNLKSVKGIAGGAILADGKVGLILDIQALFSLVARQQ